MSVYYENGTFRIRGTAADEEAIVEHIGDLERELSQVRKERDELRDVINNLLNDVIAARSHFQTASQAENWRWSFERRLKAAGMEEK